MLKILYRMLENPKVYDLVQRLLGGDRVYRALKEVIGAQLKNISYSNVLDVGCGTGLFGDCFSSEYTGIDINQEYIKKAGTKRGGVYLVADATRLPFETGTFDLVFTLGVLHHLDVQNQDNMLKEMWRVCKAGGHILIMDGLVPSNRLNVIGYVLAKLDRGRFKTRVERFKEMVETVCSERPLLNLECYNMFPYEFVAAVVKKKESRVKEPGSPLFSFKEEGKN
jgi:ubiquinone/menaquinone biosynthesis C-methylase UbiE